MAQVRLDGRILQDGKTCIVDHVVQKFTIFIRSSAGVGHNILKDTIQQRYEVVEMKEEDRIEFVH